MNNQVRPADIVIMASGAVAIIFSFLTWFEVEGGDSWNAWSTDITFPLGTYIGLIGLAMGVLVALTSFANVNLPDNVVGFTWTQVFLALSAFAVLLGIGWLIMDPFGGGIDKGIGLWLSVLAAIGLLVGSIMRHVEGAGPAVPGNQPPTPF